VGYKTEMALRMPGVQQSTAFSANSRPDGLVENVSLLCSQVVNPFSPTHQVSRIFQTPNWTLDMVNNKEEKVRQFIYQNQSKYNNAKEVKFPLTLMGILAPGLGKLDPPLGPPSARPETFS
jgi:hypothetical protein